MQAGTWRDLGVVSNLVSAVLVGCLAVTARPRTHGAVTLAVTALFAYFLLSAALELR